MAIQSDPTVLQLIADGMVEGGQYTVTNASTAVSTFQGNQFQTIKTELWDACKTDKLLETETAIVAAPFTSQISWPTDFDSEIRLVLFDADLTFRGIATTGSSTTITLGATASGPDSNGNYTYTGSTFSQSPTLVEGRYLFIVTGTGAGQWGQILSYNDTTKVVTLTATWNTPNGAAAVSPDATSVFLIGIVQSELPRRDYRIASYPNSRPRWYDRLGSSLYVYPAPDQYYPILLEYRANMTRIDEAGTLFIKHIRERRSLWIQGIKTKTMARYDDERYAVESPIWESSKLRYAADNAVYEQTEPHR